MEIVSNYRAVTASDKGHSFGRARQHDKRIPSWKATVMGRWWGISSFRVTRSSDQKHVPSRCQPGLVPQQHHMNQWSTMHTIGFRKICDENSVRWPALLLSKGAWCTCSSPREHGAYGKPEIAYRWSKIRISLVPYTVRVFAALVW